MNDPQYLEDLMEQVVNNPGDRKLFDLWFIPDMGGWAWSSSINRLLSHYYSYWKPINNTVING